MCRLLKSICTKQASIPYGRKSMFQLACTIRRTGRERGGLTGLLMCIGCPLTHLSSRTCNLARIVDVPVLSTCICNQTLAQTFRSKDIRDFPPCFSKTRRCTCPRGNDLEPLTSEVSITKMHTSQQRQYNVQWPATTAN